MCRALILAAFALLMAGCHSEAGDEPLGPEALRDVPWALAGGIDVAGWEAVAPSATFTEDHVAGSTGCNRFTGGYEVDGDELEIKQVVTTQMACAPPADAVERAFLDALERVERWRTADGELLLIDGDDRELLRFRVPSLEGTWKATMIHRGDALESPAPGTTITATFGADGTLSGSGGCNTYRAGYRAERGELEIDPPAGTRKACADPPDVMEQEHAFLSSLPLATTYRVEGDKLSLLAADGTFVAAFERG